MEYRKYVEFIVQWFWEFSINIHFETLSFGYLYEYCRITIDDAGEVKFSDITPPHYKFEGMKKLAGSTADFQIFMGNVWLQQHEKQNNFCIILIFRQFELAILMYGPDEDDGSTWSTHRYKFLHNSTDTLKYNVFSAIGTKMLDHQLGNDLAEFDWDDWTTGEPPVRWLNDEECKLIDQLFEDYDKYMDEGSYKQNEDGDTVCICHGVTNCRSVVVRAAIRRIVAQRGIAEDKQHRQLLRIYELIMKADDESLIGLFTALARPQTTLMYY